MKLEMFFEKFELFADAPNAIKKMRELVLELAVQGKLVEQKPAEGDGHALLRQIHKKNQISATETDAGPVDSELASFPSSWATSKLGEVAEIIRGVTFPGSAKLATPSNGDVACLRTASVQAEIDWDDLIYISPTHVSREDQWVIPNDIMISMANSYALVGKVAIVREVPQKATFGAFLAAIRPVLIESYFLLYVLRSPRMQAAFRASSSQTTNIANISLGRMRPLPFPLPPLAEQKRIVAKVDELMALCDRLEAQQRERDARHTVLARASLTRFADAPTPANLNLLFHQSYEISPEGIRNAILTQAIQGKLVRQDSKDENALVLLQRVDAERESLVNSRKIRRHDILGPVAEEVIPFDIPDSWQWRYLADVCFLISDGAHHTPQYLAIGVPFLSVKDVSGGKINFTKTRFISEEAHRELCKRCCPALGDILLTKIGTTGIAVIIDEDRDFSIFVSLALLKFSQLNIDGQYLKYLINSPFVRQQSADNTQGVGNKNLVLRLINRFLIPIPPLAEQRRIVAKVDQLMALVDQLESQLATASTTAAQLLDALVAELTGTVCRAPERVEPQLDQGDIANPDDPPSASASTASASNAGRAGARPFRDGEPSATDAAALLALLRERGSLSSSEAQSATGLDPATLRGQFKALIDQGLARTVGQRRGMRYLTIAKAAHAE